jgi:hypothetical protein
MATKLVGWPSSKRANKTGRLLPADLRHRSPLKGTRDERRRSRDQLAIEPLRVADFWIMPRCHQNALPVGQDGEGQNRHNFADKREGSLKLYEPITTATYRFAGD